MGRAKNGILGAVSGKVGNLIFYISQSEARVRTAGKRQAALTAAELINTSKMAVLMNFFKYIKPFIKLGFGTNLQNSKQNYHNAATSYNKKNALILIDNKVQLAYDRIRVSSGTGLEPEQPSVKLIENELQFSWTHNEALNWEAGLDQVMMMAFFPEENMAVTEPAGAKRRTGHYSLLLPTMLAGKRMELYISFIAQDRQRVSNSIYLGRLN